MRSYTVTQPAVVPALYDKWLIFIIVCLMALGTLMMTSASIVISDRQMHQPFYFLYKQAIFMTAGIVLGSFVLQVDTAYWEKIGGYLLLGVMMMLVLVLIPGIGRTANGSARWLGYGPLSFQISELTKFMNVIYLAGFLVRHREEVQGRFSGFVKPMSVLGLIAMLLLLEPDFGATVVVVITSLGLMFLAGMRLRHFMVLLTGALSALGFLAMSAPYRLARMTAFMDPWARPFDTGYQLTQSLIAFGRGGWFGVGLGKSIQKMFYLPEAHTDFLFAVIAEELGLVGMLLVLGLFTCLVLRIFQIGRTAHRLHRPFAGFTAYGFGMWVAIQFTVSIGVNSGLLPTKGLTLPLMSYGGSSILVTCMAMAVILRIDHENRLAALGIQ